VDYLFLIIQVANSKMLTFSYIIYIKLSWDKDSWQEQTTNQKFELINEPSSEVFPHEFYFGV
jgi:hypothetical protein